MGNNQIHRWINTILFTVILGVIIVYIGTHQHNIEDCEARLYEKITGQPMPEVER